MHRIRALPLVLLLPLAACSSEAPIDNGAATSCAAGTPENEASSVCDDVTLTNGETISLPPTENGMDDMPRNMVVANTD